MAPATSRLDFLSPFEELILTAVLEAGPEPDEMQVWRKTQEIARRDSIFLIRVQLALKLLQGAGCLYSWPVDPAAAPNRLQPCHYRVTQGGQSALEAAAKRRDSKSTREYFNRAGRFGVLWDLWCGSRQRRRAKKYIET